MTEPKYIDVNGHRVLAERADDFFDGRTGQPISDEDYDESMRRQKADNSHLVPEQFRGELA